MTIQHTPSVIAEDPPVRSGSPSLVQRGVLARLARIESGVLTVHEGSVSHTFGTSRAGLHDGVGAGEAYAKQWWSSPDPTAVVRALVRNREALTGLDLGLARLSRPFLAAYHALRRNSERGSRRNIRAHYDVSNDFFRLFLDETMTYSCGIFEREDSSLREASVAKIDRLCQKLDLQPEDHLLEIGTGWGAFALHAAREYGCRVTTTTISREQHALAEQRFREAGLADRITLLAQDYRRLEGTFDKLVSVEMIEAVGAEYFQEFFRSAQGLLRPGGSMALQAITIADQHFDRARRSVDFIRRHIFPGSCIPSVTALCSAMTAASDLRLVDLEDIGAHYVTTLAAWRRNLRERWSEARAAGYSEEFLRTWEFYFVYCEGGFAEGHISDVHMLLRRPGAGASPAVRTVGAGAG